MAVAENTTYRGSQILIGLMNDDGTLPATPKALDISKFCTSGIVMNDNRESKEYMPVVNAGRQASTIYGAKKPGGTLELELGTQLLPLLISGVIGDFTTAAKVVSAWTATTVTAVGDIVQHSGGKYLVAQKVLGTATTGATEPDLTGITEDRTVLTTIDGADASNGVYWMVRDNLYDYSATDTFCIKRFFIIERNAEGCGSANVFDRISTNVRLGTFNIEKSDGTVSYSQSITLVAEQIQKSSEADFTDITVDPGNITTPNESFFKEEDVTIRIDGAKYGTMHRFMMNHSREFSQTLSTEPNENIIKFGGVVATGETTIDLDPTEYDLLENVDFKSVVVTMDKGDGEIATITYPAVQFANPTEERNGNEPILMMANLKPTGDASNAMISIAGTTSLNWIPA